jgi:DNA helicase IV
VVEVLGSPEAVVRAELDVGYRVPVQILDLANRLLPYAGVAVPPSRSARRTTAVPEVIATDDLAASVVATATALTGVHHSVAVIAPDGLHAAIVAAGLPIGEVLAAPISLITPAESKGLEFDAVVVAEPLLVVESGEKGVRLLYVAMTRAVQHLSIIHSLGLPDPLAA